MTEFMDIPPEAAVDSSTELGEFSEYGLPKALAEHVRAGRLTPEIAAAIKNELDIGMMIAGVHSDAARRSNLVHLSNGKGIFDKVPKVVNANEATFAGNPSDLVKLARAASLRFADPTHENLKKPTRIAFDFDRVDQFGDWDAPLDLDARLARAIDPKSFASDEPDVDVAVLRHDRDHTAVNYSFWQTHVAIGERAAVVVVRKRPIADVAIMVDGEPVCVEIFRKSWFLVSASESDDTSFYRKLRAVQEVRGTEQEIAAAQDQISKYVHASLAPIEGQSVDDHRQMLKSQTLLIPCTMTYIARVRDPSAPVVAAEPESQKPGIVES